MINRVVAGISCVGVALIATVTVSGAAPAPALASIPVPAAIDATGGRDVTAELNLFLAGVRPGTTVNFPDHARYRVEGVVGLDRRRNVTIEGHESTLIATTDGSGVAPSAYNLRAHWPRMREHVAIRESVGITIHDLTVQGPNIKGIYRPALEAQAGFVVSGSRSVTLDTVTARATYGDGVYIVGASKDVLLKNCTFDHNGRQGVAVVGGENVTITGCTITNTGRSAIDLEPGHGFVRTVHIQDNKVRRYTNFLLAAVGAGVGVQDVWLVRNHVEGAKGVSVYVGTERSVRPGIHVIDNTGDGTSRGYQGVLMRFTRFDGIEVRGNHQRVARGVTPVLLHDSCHDTVIGNNFGGATTVVGRDGDCATPMPPLGARSTSGPSTPFSAGAGRKVLPPAPATIPVPTTVAARPASSGTSPIALVVAVGIGALAGVGGTVLTQWGRRNREP